MGVDLAVEEQFGPYLVYERLGVGGMATVHRALERGIEGFERIVALKRLLPHLAEDASFIKAFVREAKLASLLNHNNIVQIFELGRVGTEYFISMEYIDGRDIRRILRHARKVTGPPPINVTIGLLLQLCDALDYAHAKADDDGHPLGLVHRDVSPSNLLVTSAGHLKVIDFGIAKAQSSQLRTQTGRVKGKLAYMAPEAVSAKELDARSDLWAAGVIAHELLTARPLFASKNEYQTLLKVQRGDIAPPSTYNPKCPPALDAVVLRALEREPDDRYLDASALRDDLLEIRRALSLQTGHRDIAQWLEWAFALEASGGFPAPPTGERSGSSFDASGRFATAHTPTPRPRREEDEAVEIAWGGGENAGSAPIELDDVPDVSAKHLGAAPQLPVAGEYEHDDLDDDIPPPQPSHGVRRPVRDTAPQRVLPQEALPPDDDDDDDSALVLAPPSREPTAGARLDVDRLRRGDGPSEPASRVSTSGPVASGNAPGAAGTPPPPPLRRPSGSFARLQSDVLARSSSEMDATVLTGPAPEVTAEPASEASAPPPRADSARRITAPGVRAATIPPPIAIAPPAPPARSSSAPTVPPPAPALPAAEVSRAVSVSDAATGTDAGGAPATSANTSTPTADRTGDVPRKYARSLSELSVVTPAPTSIESIAEPPVEVPVEIAPPARPSSERPVARDIGDLTDSGAISTQPRRKRPSTVSIGSNIVAREAGRGSKAWLLLLVVILLGGAAAAVTVYWTSSDGLPVVDETPKPAPVTPKEVGTIKFVIESPDDAEITIEGEKHVGSPWSIELPPGAYQVHIQREGYKARLMTVELSAHETQTLVFPLEKLTSTTPVGANLILSSTPTGLEVVLDGKLQSKRTPMRAPIAVGNHTVVLRQNGLEVWRHQFTAEPNVDHEFNPSMAEDKQRERKQRAEQERRKHEPRKVLPPVAGDAAPGGNEKTVIEPPVDKDALPPEPPTPQPPVVHPQPVPPVTKPPPPIPPAPPPRPVEIARTGPVTILPNAVTRLSGDTATFGKSRRAEVPPVVAAKVCIDTSGAVTSVQMLSRLERHTITDLTATLKTWRYTPYKLKGTAVPACFAVSFKVK